MSTILSVWLQGVLHSRLDLFETWYLSYELEAFRLNYRFMLDADWVGGRSDRDLENRIWLFFAVENRFDRVYFCSLNFSIGEKASLSFVLWPFVHWGIWAWSCYSHKQIKPVCELNCPLAITVYLAWLCSLANSVNLFSSFHFGHPPSCCYINHCKGSWLTIWISSPTFALEL